MLLVEDIRIWCGACCRSIAVTAWIPCCVHFASTRQVGSTMEQTARSLGQAPSRCVCPVALLPVGTTAAQVIIILPCLSPVLLHDKEHSSGIVQCRWEATPALVFFIKLRLWIIMREETVMEAERLEKMSEVQESKAALFKSQRNLISKCNVS